MEYLPSRSQVRPYHESPIMKGSPSSRCSQLQSAFRPIVPPTMFGTFQQSQLRIEIEASAAELSRVILSPTHLRRWMLPHVISGNLPDKLYAGLTFTSWLGPVPVEHQVERVEVDSVRFILSRAVDGFHEWYWGEGWVQSSLEGISLAPLHLGNTSVLLRLRAYLALQRQFQQSETAP
jgi:hypothetical protein